VNGIDVSGSVSSRELAFRARLEVINPSVVNIIQGGRLSLDFCDVPSGISLGLVVIDSFYLDPQGNKTTLNTDGILRITEENSAVVQQFVSRLVSGIDNDVELRGTLSNHSIGTSIPLLSMAIANLRIQTQVLGLDNDRTLVRKILFRKLTLLEITSITIGTVKALVLRMELKNPFSAPLIITGIHIRADLGGVINETLQVGILTDNSPMIVDAYQETFTPYMQLTLTSKLTTLMSLISPLLNGTLRLSLSGFMNVTIGD
jgi:hypothetical protein